MQRWQRQRGERKIKRAREERTERRALSKGKLQSVTYSSPVRYTRWTCVDYMSFQLSFKEDNFQAVLRLCDIETPMMHRQKEEKLVFLTCTLKKAQTKKSSYKVKHDALLHKMINVLQKTSQRDEHNGNTNQRKNQYHPSKSLKQETENYFRLDKFLCKRKRLIRTKFSLKSSCFLCSKIKTILQKAEKNILRLDHTHLHPLSHQKPIIINSVSV